MKIFLLVLLSGFALPCLAQTNGPRVYVTNFVTADNAFRQVEGKLYNVNKSVLWTNVAGGECVHVAKNGIVVQQYKFEYNETRAPVNYRRDAFGNAAGPRSMVTSETTTKVPTKKLFFRNFLDMRTIAVGTEVKVVRAMRVEPVDVKGERLECWDCGTPNRVPVVTVKTNR